MSESTNNATFNVGDRVRIRRGTYRGSGDVVRVVSTLEYTVATNIPVNGIMHLSPDEMELIPPPEEESLSGNPNEDDMLNIDGDDVTYYGTNIGR